MPKANTKQIIFILIPLTLAILSGCSGPEEKRANSLNKVAQLRAAGDRDAALNALDALNQAFPNDSIILRKIGDIHEELGNTTEAAFYLSAAYAHAPDDVELLYQTYRAQENATQTEAAYDLLEALAIAKPDAISDELWMRLGELRAQAQQTQPALDAYLKGVDPENTPPSPETAAAIGTLFKQLDNLPQAERWFKIAANSDDPNALPALFGLIDIHLRNKNWVDAEAVIAQLDKQFPGAVDASQWSKARAELEHWRSAQDAMQAELAKAKKAKEAAAQAAAEIKAAQATTEIKAAQATAVATEAPASDTTAGKAQIIEDIEHAEAMADTPALEAEPAVAQLTINGIDADAPAIEPSTAISPTLTPRSLDHLLADAESASTEHDYKQAIQLYWQALGRANNRADIWNLLSLAYRLDGQTKNAETTALEATRLAPEEIDYTLDYLRTIQRTKKPDDFLAELETAYDRFPRSPEIALSLARGYERISGNHSTAIVLYERFLDLAPNHPLRSEAETALSRLR